jgi:hypothetical protein
MIFGWPTFQITCNTQQNWTIEEISIFSNSSHLEWKAGLSDTTLKETHPRIIPAKFVLIWFSGFRGEDLNVIFYQNMPNLHNRYKQPRLPFKMAAVTKNRNFFNCPVLL